MSIFTTATEIVMLTTKPLIRQFSMEHPEWIYILPMADVAAADLTSTITYTDATTDTLVISLGALTKYAATKVNIGEPVQEYSQVDTKKTISHITLKVNNDDDELTLYPYYPSQISDQVRAFYYRNSYGGFDSLICIGDQADGFEATGQLAQLPITSGYVVTTSPEYVSVNQEGLRSGSMFTGYKTNAEINALKDMQLVNDVHELKTIDSQDVLLPIILQGGIQYPSARNKLKGIQFNYRYAWDDRALERIN